MTPSADELSWFANGLANGAVSDAQAGAFAMAVCLNGLGEAGRVAVQANYRWSSAEAVLLSLYGKLLR